jgi:hypothetical protein
MAVDHRIRNGDHGIRLVAFESFQRLLELRNRINVPLYKLQIELLCCFSGLVS